MKTLFRFAVVSLLAFSLATLCVQDLNRNANAQLAPAVFVLGATAVGAYIILTISKNGGQGQTHTFVLQARQRYVENGHVVTTWISIATNSFRMPPDSVFNAFYVWCETNRCIGMYRIQEVQWPEGNPFCPPPVVGGPLAQPVIY